MATHRQLPDVFRRLHPKLKTPWLSLVFFAGLLSILVLLPGKTDFLGNMYAFGAMLSFTIAHLSIIALRLRTRDDLEAFKVRPSITFRGVDWPLFAIFGAIGTGAAWFVVVVQQPGARWAGLGWLIIGLSGYVVYRRVVLRQPLTATLRAPVIIGPAVALEYRNVLVPVKPGRASEEAIDLACRLAADRGATIGALSVVVVPLDLPVDTQLEDQERDADDALDVAAAIAELYGVKFTERIVRARHPGRAIVDEAKRRQSEIIVMGAPRAGRGRGVFSDTVDFVLKHAPCRVMVAASTAAA
jgi:APA family basic amino acid/polyamine antiporter